MAVWAGKPIVNYPRRENSVIYDFGRAIIGSVSTTLKENMNQAVSTKKPKKNRLFSHQDPSSLQVFPAGVINSYLSQVNSLMPLTASWAVEEKWRKIHQEKGSRWLYISPSDCETISWLWDVCLWVSRKLPVLEKGATWELGAEKEGFPHRKKDLSDKPGWTFTSLV